MRRTSGSATAFLTLPWLLCALLGCATGANLELRSTESAAALRPVLPRMAYISSDRNTADIYMTDLPLWDLDPGVDLSRLTGQIVHLHMFLTPRAGRTPIERTASSVTIRHVVLADGAIGIYGGGGFLLTDGEPGGATFGGSVRDATMRLTAGTETFLDRLGPSIFRARFRAPHEPGMARQIGRQLEDIIAHVNARARAGG